MFALLTLQSIKILRGRGSMVERTVGFRETVGSIPSVSIFDPIV